MTKIKDSHFFLPRDRVSIIGESTPLRDVLPRLSGRIVGFLVQGSAQPPTYRGYVSGSQILDLVKSGAWKALETEHLIKLIENPVVDVTMVPLAEQVLDANDESTSTSHMSETVHRVESNEIEGILLPDRIIAVHIPPKIFWCTNPENRHPNASLGDCQSCPFPVIG